MNASFIRERQWYSSVVTAGPLSTHHMILFAMTVWKRNLQLRVRNRDELLPMMLKIQGSASSTLNLSKRWTSQQPFTLPHRWGCDHTTITPPLPLPPPPLLQASWRCLPSWDGSILITAIWHRMASSGLCLSLWAWHSVLFLVPHFSPIVCSKCWRQPDGALTPTRSLWSDKWEMCCPNMNALRCKHFAFLNTRSSPARWWRAHPEGADKQPKVHRRSHKLCTVHVCLHHKNTVPFSYMEEMMYVALLNKCVQQLRWFHVFSVNELI